MSEYIVELDSKHSTVLRLAFAEEMRGGDFVRGEIVRCRDCKHYDPHPTDGGVCFLPDGDGDFARWEVEPDGFCNWGERREQ